MERVLESTADGSSTIYIPEIDEHYHSIKGALTESRYIYIECGMMHCRKDVVNILEIGFGTGLNAYLTALQTDKQVVFHTMELYPLDASILSGLNYNHILPEAGLWDSIHSAAWNEYATITPRFTLHKINADFTCTELPKEVDVVYYDAFAPEKQPEMWNARLMTKLYDCMARQGILTTYCAKGIVRRNLVSTGFLVERLPGPPGGKREILRAVKP